RLGKEIASVAYIVILAGEAASRPPLVFPITGRPAKIVGRTPGPRPAPWPACPLWMRLILLATGGSREVTYCSGICSSGGFAQGGPARTGGAAPQFLRNSQNWKIL